MNDVKAGLIASAAMWEYMARDSDKIIAAAEAAGRSADKDREQRDVEEKRARLYRELAETF